MKMWKNEHIAKLERESLMEAVVEESIDWLKEVSNDDILQHYFVSFPPAVELRKMDALADAPAYQVIGRLEFLTIEANQIKYRKRQEEIDKSNRIIEEQINKPRGSTAAQGPTPVGKASTGIEVKEVQAKAPASAKVEEIQVMGPAIAEDEDVDMNRPDSPRSEDSTTSVMLDGWVPQAPPTAPEDKPSDGTRFDVNEDARRKIMMFVRNCGENFIRRCARIKAKQIKGYGDYIEQESYNELKRAMIQAEMGPKACYDWIRNMDEDDE